MYIEHNKTSTGKCDSCGAYKGGMGGYGHEPHASDCKYVLKARLEELEKRLKLKYNTANEEYDEAEEA